MVNESINDLFSDLIGNSVCACVHPKRLANSHLVDDGVKLRTVTDLLTHLCNVVLDAYPSNIGASGGWQDFSGQHLEYGRLSSSVYAEETEAFPLKDSDTQLVNGHKISIEFCQILGDDWIRLDEFPDRIRMDALSLICNIRILTDLSLFISIHLG